MPIVMILMYEPLLQQEEHSDIFDSPNQHDSRREKHRHRSAYFL